MAEIVEFLRARLDEDERDARLVQSADIYDVPASTVEAPEAAFRRLAEGPWLADIAAKRELLDAFDLSQSREIRCDAWLLLKPCIYAMAAIWADHPDFDPSWTVTE